jgi:hypothetical protein
MCVQVLGKKTANGLLPPMAKPIMVPNINKIMQIPAPISSRAPNRLIASVFNKDNHLD